MSWLLNSPSELTEKLYPGLKYSVMPQQGKTVLLKISNLKKKKKKKNKSLQSLNVHLGRFRCH